MFNLQYNMEEINLSWVVESYCDRYALRPGLTVGIQTNQNDQIVIHYLACRQTGVLPVFIPHYFTKAMLAHIYSAVGMDFLIIDDEVVYPDRLNPPFGKVHPFEVGSLIYTSTATQHLPKMIYRDVVSIHKEAKRFTDMLSIKAEDALFPAVPLYHSFGLICGFLSAEFSASRLVLTSTFHVSKMNAMLDAGHPTILLSSPGIYDILARHPGAKDAVKSLRHILSTGAPLPDAVQSAFQLTYGCQIASQYGTSEIGCIALSCTGNPPNSYGLIYPGIDIRISQDDEILIDAHGAVNSYIVENSVVSICKDDLYATGDLGSLENNILHVKGRKEHFVNINGQKLAISMICSVIKNRVNIQDLYVDVHVDGSTKYTLFTSDSVDIRSLSIYLKENLPSFVCPKEIFIEKPIMTWKQDMGR